MASCLRELVDVSQVGVVEDDSDPIQGVRLPYSLQLHLGTNVSGFVQTIQPLKVSNWFRRAGLRAVLVD